MISRFLSFIPNTEVLLEYIENLNSKRSNNFEYIRANNLKIKSEELEKTLIDKGYRIDKTILNEVFKIEKAIDENNWNVNILPSIGSTLEYLKGYYYIQDLGPCLAVEELGINENNSSMVLDMAASPGGKTTFIAQKMNNNGNIIGENIDKLDIKFDRILLDAPCSCEGIIAKDQTRKKSREFKDIEICSIK